MYVLQSQCNKTTTQKAIWEIHKYIEIKEYTSAQPIGQRRNHEGSQKTLSWMKTETQHTKCDSAKAVLRGKCTAINAYMKRKDLKSAA